MSRPTLTHDGFLVPNAQDVTKPELAEPDRIDFNTVAHARWGVINGCEVTVAGSLATNTAGTALVNGTLVTVTAGQNVNVGAGGPQDRFDLVGVNQSGLLVRVSGTESLDPVFPDVPLDVTVLAAVLCTAGGGNYVDNVIDKRKFLADSLLTKIPSVQDLILNRNGSGHYYRVGGDGITSWLNDVTLKRHSAGTLQVSDHLRVDLTIWAGGGIQAQSLVASQRIIGSNLRNGTVVPDDLNGNPADMFQNSADGSIYVHQNGHWEEMATVRGVVPVATVITSLQPKEYMTPLGWLPVDGETPIMEAAYPDLVAVLVARGWSVTGTAPTRSVMPPNANKRVLMVDFDRGGQLGGTSAISIGLENMPVHIHDAKVQNGGGYQPTVTLQRNGGHKHAVTGGAHVHTEVPDPGHVHNGADHGNGGGFICAAWGGRNKIDAFFNDRSHTYSVEMAEWTRPATTGITYIGSGGSAHPHDVTQEGDHDHVATISPVPQHGHAVTETPKGNGAPLPYSPAHIAVFCYVRG